jgi:hypothetical protein
MVMSLLYTNTYAAENVVLQTYVTSWEPRPVAQFRILNRKLELTYVRYRVKGEINRWSDWWRDGKVITIGKKEFPIFNLPVDNLTPGTYEAQVDLRTPLGAEYMETALRVPYVARFSGEKIVVDNKIDDWPHTRYKYGIDKELDIFNVLREQKVLFSWDMENMYFYIPETASVPFITIDALYSCPGKYIYRINIEKGKHEISIPWRKLYPSGPFIGSVLRVGIGKTTPDVDLLLLGSGKPMYFGALIVSDSGDDQGPPREILEALYKMVGFRDIGAAKEYEGVTYVRCGFNEPELFHFTDREKVFVEDLNREVERIRREKHDTKIIAGKFCAGDPGIIRSMYAAGFRDNFDVLEIHPYSNNPRTGCDIGGVVASHETLVELGMGHKRIFLGEGWGPTRILPQVSRTQHDAPVTPEEADCHRQYFWNGYRCLITPTVDYNPEWVLGAIYFTFNDNVGGTYWRLAATPHYNAKGEIDYYLIGNLAFPDLESLNAFFCNGGLVDFYGNPKGSWLFDFPPSFPDVRILPTWDENYILQDKEYFIPVDIINATTQNIKILSLELNHRTYKFRGKVVSKISPSLSEVMLAPGEIKKANISFHVEECIPEALRLAIELEYLFNNVKYVSDATIRTEIKSPVEAFSTPDIVVLEPLTGENKSTIILQNNTNEIKNITLFPKCPEHLLIDKANVRISIPPKKSIKIDVLFKDKDNLLANGIYDIKIWEGGDAISVVKPIRCVYRKKHKITIDGDLSEWAEFLTNKENVIPFSKEVGIDHLELPEPFPLPNHEVGRKIKHEKTSTTEFSADALCIADDDYLYLAVVVRDNYHQQDYASLDIWKQDSIQIAIDPLMNGAEKRKVTPTEFLLRKKEECYSDDDYELGVALTPHGAKAYRIWAPDGVKRGEVANAKVSVIRDENKGYTIYEIALPWEEIGCEKQRISAHTFSEKKSKFVFSMDLLVNNFDGKNRYTLGCADAIAFGKYPSRFIPVMFVER